MLPFATPEERPMAPGALSFNFINPHTKLFPDTTSPDDEIVDVGAFPHLAMVTKLLAPCVSESTVYLEHTLVRESNAWLTLLEIPIGPTATQVAQEYYLTEFLRYLRWRTDENAQPSTMLVVNGLARP